MIFLVRHGQTPGNAGRVVQTPETPLSELGRQQAQRVARRLVGERPGAILTSDLARARETAAAIAAATGAVEQLDPLLQERNFGSLRGTPYSAIGFDPFAEDYAPPEGETWAVFHGRVDRAWDRIRETALATEGPLVVVTHGLFLLSLATRHLPLPSGETLEVSGFPNTSLTRIDRLPPHAIHLLACIAHLDESVDAAGPAGRRACSKK